MAWVIALQFKSNLLKPGKVIKLDLHRDQLKEIVMYMELLAEEGLDVGGEYVYPEQVKTISVKRVV